MTVREYVDLLKREGFLYEIDEEVDWNMEATALSALLCWLWNDNGRVALKFNNLKGYGPGCGSILLNWHNGPGLSYWQRMAWGLGLPRDITYPGFISYLRKGFRNYIKPIEISRADAPCKEVIRLGKEASLVDFPFPVIHGTDGGRYSTVHAVINQDPDTGWVNVATYRMMIKGSRRWAHLWIAGQHGPTIHLYKWDMRGNTMPICVAIGSDIELFHAQGAQAPAGVCEYDLAGGLAGKPVEVVRAETNNLLVPANAEIVIEGEARPGERTDEGPFSEMAGYTHGRNISPVFRVTAITYRKNPIVPAIVMGARIPEGVSYGFHMSALDYLQSKGHPVVDANCNWIAEPVWTLSVDPDRPTRIKEIVQDFFGFKSMLWTPWLAMVDADIDLENNTDTLEEIGLNCDVRELKKTISDTDAMLFPLIFYSPAEDRFLMRGGAMYGYDCTTKFRPLEWVPRKATFEKAYSEDMKEEVIKRWKEKGFDQDIELKTPATR